MHELRKDIPANPQLDRDPDREELTTADLVADRKPVKSDRVPDSRRDAEVLNGEAHSVPLQSNAESREANQSTVLDRDSSAIDRPTDVERSVGEHRDDGHRAQLFQETDLHDFRSRWDSIQTGFVDEPRTAVEKADSLVASVVQRIAEQFAGERAQLEKQWDSGDNVSTEDLRQALKRYRAFFDRLLSV
jgi:hypothetical protein